MDDSVPTRSPPTYNVHLEIDTQTDSKLNTHIYSNSPTASTATTLHVPLDTDLEPKNTSANEFQPQPSNQFQSRSSDSDASSIWRPSASLETATAIPQPMFTRSATRLTLTKPMSVSLYMHSSASSPELLAQSSRENSPDETQGRDPRRGHADGKMEGSEFERGQGMRRTRQSLISISHGMHPLGSNPPDPRDTIRYSVVEIPKTPEIRVVMKRRSVLKEHMVRVRSVCLGCLKGAFSRGAR